MAKTPTATAADEAAPKNHTTIQPKTAAKWGELLQAAQGEHWRKIRVVLQIREQFHAGKPKSLDAEEAMINARGLGEVLEARALELTDEEKIDKAEEVKDEGLCEFYRREGKPGMWLPTFQIKAMLKENWTAMGFSKKIAGSRSRLAECVFAFSPDYADREWIKIGDKPDGIRVHVSHTKGPKGPVASIKRNEYLLRPKIEFLIYINKRAAVELPDDAMAQVLYHASVHGLGANRSQQFGTFDLLTVEDVQ